MLKHTQTISGQQPTNCLSVFDHFVSLGLKVFKTYLLLTKAISLCGLHKKDHHKCFTVLENHLLGIFLGKAVLKKKKWKQKRWSFSHNWYVLVSFM